MDNKDLGRIFRSLRIAKNKNLSNATNSSFSLSQLSKFERGDTDLSAQKMLVALNSLNVKVEEFMYLSDDSQGQGISSFFNCFISAERMNDVSAFKTILAKQERLAHENPNSTFYRMNCLMIKSALADLGSVQVFSENDCLEINNFLTSSSEWTFYELFLLAKVMNKLVVENIISITEEMVKRVNLIKDSWQHINIIVEILTKTVLVCLENNLVKQSKHFLGKINCFNREQLGLKERNILMFTRGLYLFKSRNISEGTEQMKTAIKIFHFLDCFREAKEYEQYYKLILKSTSLSV